MRHGFTDTEWSAAKGEIQAILSQRAASTNPFISYGDLVSRLTTVQMTPDDPRLAHLLGEISTEEDAAGRGMLSVLVVHGSGDRRPGGGFFELARKLGRKIKDQDQLWADEIQRVRAAWTRNGTA